MTYYNKTINKHYRGGVLKTNTGTIFNPSTETLKANGYEPYTPPVVEPTPPTHEEVEAMRQDAYRNRVDPITCEISRLRDMGGTEDEIAEAIVRREHEVANIKAEFPYPTV